MLLEKQILREQLRTICAQEVSSVLQEYSNGIFVAMSARNT